MNDAIWIGVAVLLGIGAFFVLRKPPEPEPTPVAPPRAKEPAAPVRKESAATAAPSSGETKKKKKKASAKLAATDVATPPAPVVRERTIAKLTFEEDDDEITLLAPQRGAAMSGFLEEKPGAKPTQFVIDEDAAIDEPTGPLALILVHGAAQTDTGKTRKRNEDSYLVLKENNLFVVADGMGGYAGGDIASRLAVETVEETFRSKKFPGTPFEGLPPRASELVQSVEAANEAIHAEAEKDPKYRGMGTTVVAARFSARKQRLYVAHVGDSRCYRLREGKMVQVTVDHTMASAGATGPGADRLMRALGVNRTVEVDLLVAKPKQGDVYLLCTDGLSKMASEEEIAAILKTTKNPDDAAKQFIQLANDHGGKDNVTVIVVRVDPQRD
jgi:protein phosphatase